MTSFSISVAQTDADLQAMADVYNRLSGGVEQLTVADLRHDLDTQRNSYFLIARVGDQTAGSGVCKPSSSAGCAFAMVRVLPEFRKQGLGTELYAALSEQARRIERKLLQGRVVETDQEALDYFQKRGFTTVVWVSKVVLNVNEAGQIATELPAGVEIVSLSARPDLAESVYELACEALPDIPMPEALTVPPMDEWLALEMHAPNALLDGSFVAISEGQVIGYAGMAKIQDDTAEHLLTGVRRAWRRRGIAAALKQRQIAWAKSAGYQQLITYHLQGNEPIRNLNVRLGYQPEPASVLLRGPLLERK